MSWQIRPFNPTQTEYETVVALRNEVDPESPSSVAIWQHWDGSRPAESKFERWVVEDKYGRITAFTQFDETSPQSKKFEFNFGGMPIIWQNGMAEALLATILQHINQHDADMVTTQARESDSEKLQLLKTSGFSPAMRYPISQLDVQKFDYTTYKVLFEQLSEHGIRIEQPPIGWYEDRRWQKLIHELDWQLMQDVPHHEARTQTPFAQFVQEELNHPNFLPDGYFIAFDDDTPVGMTNFVRRGGRIERLATSITGVVRSHRRMGIATGLKVKSIQFAQQIGAKIIVTNNEENNPMYLINLRLGFEAQPAWVDWEKQL